MQQFIFSNPRKKSSYVGGGGKFVTLHWDYNLVAKGTNEHKDKTKYI